MKLIWPIYRSTTSPPSSLSLSPSPLSLVQHILGLELHTSHTSSSVSRCSVSHTPQTPTLSLYLPPTPHTSFFLLLLQMVSFISSPEMLRTICFLSFFFCFGLTDAGQERVNLLHLVTNPTPMTHSDLPMAISVGHENLKEISSSVLQAETWLRYQVLTHYPGTKITTILVGDNVLCNMNHQAMWDFVLPTMKNLHHSLQRWGLEKDIKLSPVFSSQCLEKDIQPLLGFLKSCDSTYTVNEPSLVSSFKEFGGLSGVNVVVFDEKLKAKARKLYVDPFPARPTPLPEPANSIGFSTPSHIANTPLPPLIPKSPSPTYFSFAPQTPPYAIPYNPPPYVMPSNPPDGSIYPPCYNPGPSATPPPMSTPGRGHEKGLWCVAKPSVPEENLQQAMDYACGVGGADCEEIQTHGSCFYPDTVISHASYAFNSYWQRNKNNGGTCDFGATAMLISSDPSFMHCRFILTT